MHIRDEIVCWNERVKLAAGFWNAIGLGLIGFALLKPMTEDLSKLSWLTLIWAVVGLAMHSISLDILGRPRKASS